MKVKVASIQYQFTKLQEFSDFESKLSDLFAQVEQGGVVVLPEYFSMELVSTFNRDAKAIHKHLEDMQNLLQPFLQLMSTLARASQSYICAGSFPQRLPSGQYCNRAYFFSPDGSADFQDKLIMTRFEREVWGIVPGHELKLFETAFGRVAINICYDSEFPNFARLLGEKKVDLLLVPSCTDAAAGYHRVRIASQARALENQCYVIQSPTVGSADWCDTIDENFGAAGIFAPPDRGFPSDGMIAFGEPNIEQVLKATLDLSLIHDVRANGQVLNLRDANESLAVTSVTVKRL